MTAHHGMQSIDDFNNLNQLLSPFLHVLYVVSIIHKYSLIIRIFLYFGDPHRLGSIMDTVERSNLAGGIFNRI
jgi:hypothetical protein